MQNDCSECSERLECSECSECLGYIKDAFKCLELQTNCEEQLKNMLFFFGWTLSEWAREQARAIERAERERESKQENKNKTIKTDSNI